MFSVQRLSRGIGFGIFKRNFSAPVAPFVSHVTPPEDTKPDESKTEGAARPARNLLKSQTPSSKSSMVAAAFASLQQDNRDSKGMSAQASNDLDDKIINATSINELLAIPGQAKLTRKQTLKIVSILAEWSSIQKVKLSDFANDPRFIQMCSMLGRTNKSTVNGGKNQGTVPRNAGNSFEVDDLQMVLKVTAREEAAKLIAGLTLPQMIKVMTSLAQKKKRSTPLLRTLAFNISSNTNRLNLKECSDLLFAMATLNFRDTVLTARVCSDVESELSQNKDKPAPVGSIVTSLSLLRYRDTTILDSIAEWFATNHEVCKPTHVSNLLLSLATLNYEPSNFHNIKTKLVNNLLESDFIKSTDWLNTVWSLVVLDSVTSQQLASVLKPSFINDLEREKNGELTPAIKMKLLNLNAFAKLGQDPLVVGFDAEDPKFFVPNDATKEKRILTAGMLDALKSLVPSENHVRINRRTTLGFAIDAECVLDSKCVPLVVDLEHPGAKRIAILVHDYHDMCQGPHPALNGVHSIASRLLSKSGYSVLSVPYNEFNTSEKLLKRVEYLQKKFKTIVSE